MFARAVCLLRRCETEFVSHIFQKMLPVIFYFTATSENVFYSLVHSVTNAVKSLVTQNKKRRTSNKHQRQRELLMLILAFIFMSWRL